MTNELREILKPLLFTQRVIWFAMTASIFMYVVVAYMVVSQGASEGAPFDPPASINTLKMALAFVALGSSVAGISYRRRAFSEEKLRKTVESEVDLRNLARNQQTKDVDAERLAKLEQLSAGEQKLVGLVQSLMTPRIICLALFEAVAIFGLVLAFMTRTLPIMLPYVGAAVCLNLLVYPQFDTILARAAQWVEE